MTDIVVPDVIPDGANLSIDVMREVLHKRLDTMMDQFYEQVATSYNTDSPRDLRLEQMDRFDANNQLEGVTLTFNLIDHKAD